MCGIVGAVAKRPVAAMLLDGLKKLEYRGYDSAGVAVIDEKLALQRLRVVGKVRELENALQPSPIVGHTGIAHTRWATHGAPAEHNAHPFTSYDEFALVHNGIIENHAELRTQLMQDGYQFQSETDSEVIVHLIHRDFEQTGDLLKTIRNVSKELQGAYALGVIFKKDPERIFAIRQGSPLVIGKGQGENYIASDPLALLSMTQQFIYLEDNDIAEVSLDGVQIYNNDGQAVGRDEHKLAIQPGSIERGEHRHFMMKEIMEQQDAMAACLEGRVTNNHVLPAIFGPDSDELFASLKHVQLVACGTSYHAAMVARYWIEALAGIPCSVEIASEFRYRDMAELPDSLFLTLSQSGETADTLAALRLAKEMQYKNTLAICNVPGSTMMREAGLHFLTRAGVEIGVASTKAFITQLVSLFLFVLALRKAKGKQTELDGDLVQHLQHLPTLVRTVVEQNETMASWSKTFIHKNHALFLGRGALYPIALEGALKMKEISYIHAEGYPAGELKHGPLALVDANMPVIATVPGDALTEKSLSNLQEVHARGGKLYILSDQLNLLQQDAFADAHIFAMPTTHPMLAPILYTVPLQLLAYHVAVRKGTDVDQPRNLAKSVTVE